MIKRVKTKLNVNLD